MNQPKNNIQSGINARNWYSHQKIRLEPDNRLSLAQILRVKSFLRLLKYLNLTRKFVGPVSSRIIPGP